MSGCAMGTVVTAEGEVTVEYIPGPGTVHRDERGCFVQKVSRSSYTGPYTLVWVQVPDDGPSYEVGSS